MSDELMAVPWLEAFRATVRRSKSQSSVISHVSWHGQAVGVMLHSVWVVSHIDANRLEPFRHRSSTQEKYRHVSGPVIEPGNLITGT